MHLFSQSIKSWSIVAVIVAINLGVAVASIFFSPLIQFYGALRLSTIFLHEWWRFFTYMWIHADPLGFGIFHIIFNMATLWMFGRPVEHAVGKIPFLILYFLGAFVAAGSFFLEFWIRCGFSFITMSILPQSVIGASGAVVAVIAVFSCLYPDTRVYIFPLPFPLKVKNAVIGFVFVSILLMFYPPLAFIGHSAHIGGILTGFLWAWIWKKFHPVRIELTIQPME